MTIETPRGLDRGRVVLRGDSGYWLTGSVAAIFLFFYISAFTQGGVVFGLQTLPWALLILWALYLLLVRPCVILTPGRIDVVNILRRYTVKWSAIDHVGTRYQLVLHLIGGRKVTSWGASASTPRRSRSARTGSAMRSGYARRGTDPQPDKVVQAVMSGWVTTPAPDVPDFQARWDWPAVIPLLALAALCAADVLVGALVH